MKFKLNVVGAVLGGILLAGADAKASPITYTASGDITGTIGSTSLDGNAFTFVFTADTSGSFLLAGETYQNPSISTSIFISGVGAGQFSETTLVAVNGAIGVAGFEDTSGFSGIIVTNAGFDGWELVTSIGPLSGAASYDAGTFTTSLGLLTIAGATNLSFGATVTPGASTPEPSSGVLLALGLAAGTLAKRAKTLTRILGVSR